MTTMPLRIAAWITAGLALTSLTVGGCRRPAAQGTREVSAGTLVIRMPSKLGKMRRPPVEFDHDLHTAKVKGDCKTCHLMDRTGTLIPKFGRATDGQSADKLMTHYHDRCIGCHRRQDKGARGCGECHAKRPRTRSNWVAIRMDYSLHGRHSLAYQKRCAQCHHVFDKNKQKLVYEKGAEEACSACHTARPKGRRPSLREASHRACVSCHLQRKTAKHSTGPLDCAGCHTSGRQAKFVKLASPPRLMQGQTDQVWVKAAGGKARRVPFDHKGHEGTTSSCSSCHHRSLAACDSCHSLRGKKEGGGITLEQAYHKPSSVHSCVGCHRQATGKKDCAGCHGAMKAEKNPRTCAVCHRGPKPGAPLSKPVFTKAVAAPLPPTSKDFPELVTIKLLAKQFQPAQLPHARIVRKLHELAGKSSLATRFHGGVQALCSGCHHNGTRTPGARPASCDACHSPRGHATRDKPGLKVAYHRQCMGCHQKMGLAHLNTCTSCHSRAAGARSKGGKK